VVNVRLRLLALPSLQVTFRCNEEEFDVTSVVREQVSPQEGGAHSEDCSLRWGRVTTVVVLYFLCTILHHGYWTYDSSIWDAVYLP